MKNSIQYNKLHSYGCTGNRNPFLERGNNGDRLSLCGGLCMSPEPFTVTIPRETLADMYERLSMTRWTDEIPGNGWEIAVPIGMAQFPKDLVPAVRSCEERFYNLQHWTEMPRGGHIAEHEEPGLLADDIRVFFRSLGRPEQ